MGWEVGGQADGGAIQLWGAPQCGQEVQVTGTGQKREMVKGQESEPWAWGLQIITLGGLADPGTC